MSPTSPRCCGDSHESRTASSRLSPNACATAERSPGVTALPSRKAPHAFTSSTCCASSTSIPDRGRPTARFDHVSDDRAVRAMLDEVVAAFGGLDVLINNAATTRYVPLKDLDS